MTRSQLAFLEGGGTRPEFPISQQSKKQNKKNKKTNTFFLADKAEKGVVGGRGEGGEGGEGVALAERHGARESRKRLYSVVFRVPWLT